MTSPSDSTATPSTPAWVTVLLAFACGAIVANLYYSQPLIKLIAADTQMPLSAAGVLVTLSQIGYGLGLLLLVPLGDLVQARKLVAALMGLATVALVNAALADNATVFLASAFAIGLGSVAAQVLVPFAAQLAAPAQRGKAVGQVMSGLLFGILLARPLASLLSTTGHWQTVFWLSAVLMGGLALVLLKYLPARRAALSTQGGQADATPAVRYARLIASLWPLLRNTPLLQRRAAYQAGMFGAFSLFWTAAPLLLASPAYGFGQQGIALFALVGAAGAFAAPVVGRLADRGFTRGLTAAGLTLGALSFALGLLAEPGGALGLIALVVAALVLDAMVAVTLITGQRGIYSLGDAIRSRLNGLFMSLFFMGGALGSALGGWAWAHGGWMRVCWVGGLFPCAALVVFMLFDRPGAPAQTQATR